MTTLYITGAGVSAESGIPTFRGKDGYWTIGSRNYTPQQMATRAMYQHAPDQFLQWYYHRFITYRNHGPNDVHRWLADKMLITQNIDGLDDKAGNQNYISIHGRIDKVTRFHDQQDPDNGIDVGMQDAAWDKVDESQLSSSLLELFKIEQTPELNKSLKPFVLLFDEYYTELYRMSQAEHWMSQASKIIFMGTSFSVNITNIALQIAAYYNIPVEVVDPEPVLISYPNVTYHKMSALEYIQRN